MTLAMCAVLQYVFMDMTTYEETRLARDDTWAKYMKEGLNVALIVWNEKVGIDCLNKQHEQLTLWSSLHPIYRSSQVTRIMLLLCILG